MIALLAVLAVALAAVLYLLAAARAQVRELHSRLESRDRDALDLRAALEQTRDRITAAEATRARIEAELQSARANDEKLQSTFAALSQQALDVNSRRLLEMAEQVLARAHDTSRAESEKRSQALTELVRPVHDSLGKVTDKIASLEKSAEVNVARLAEQVRNLTASEEKLRSTTERLATALRAPAQRGRWGETQLRRTLELAGLRKHVDFDEQPVVQLEDGVLRPDVAVKLPGNKTVLLDAKVPLEAYLRAIEAPDAERPIHLRAHAAQLRAHVDALSRKQYWEAFSGSPEMAVLFLPSDGLLAAALDVDPALHEDAFARRIVLATPATLLAVLLTIAHVWKQEGIAANAREIANEGRVLHKRIADLSEHLAKLGRELDSAVKAYNAAVGSFEKRVLPSARRFEELKAAAVDVEVEPLLDIETGPRLPLPEAAAVPDDAN